ncbi:hypothetical protein CAAN1_05S01662 [[Candida] anglica]|uniref:Uncharacterized protein n=1 Tax=[Candida] anglica TaxID=148631 RepID=A0ABP0EG89_9ASCO
MAWVKWTHSPTTATLIATPTVDLKERASTSTSSSSSSSDSCKNSDSGSCQKPVSENALTIGLAVGLPVFLIIVVLGYFMWKNYRKEKKEALEHDPDFDENGEATALPDFPNQKQYEMEDPFHNRNSLRYPLPDAKNIHPSSSSLTPSRDPYMDSVMLPYQHQTGSKLSLDEYARNLSEYQAYGASTPRASTFMGGVPHGQFQNKTRSSSFSNASLGVGAYGPPPSKSPGHSPTKNRNFVDLSNPQEQQQQEPQQKQKQQSQQPPASPTKREAGEKYTAVPNQSTTSFGQAEFFNAKESFTSNQSSSDLESVSNSESEESREVSGANGEKFAVNYENEGELDMGGIGPDTTVQDGHFPQDPQLDDDEDDRTSYNTTEEPHDITDVRSSIPPPNVDLSFEQSSANGEGYENDRETIQDNDYSREAAVTSPFDEGAIPSDHDAFEFSQTMDTTASSANQSGLTVPTHEDEGHEKGANKLRMSDFNLLKNDSDGEEEELTEDQKEELKRMKSVYNVYFDRNNSIKVPNSKGDGNESAGPTTFQHDTSQPLPEFAHNQNYLKINNHLKTDTDYDKRMTTTSSIYTETPVFSQEERQYYHQQQEFVDEQQQFDQQQYEQQQYYYHQQQQQPREAVELPPLQQLPPPSDIRKSTLQTYTDFQPRSKNLNLSPTMGKQPFVPIENDGVWSAPISSPHNGSQATFGDDGQNTAPPPLTHSAPSATQLSRSSVVMLNPVTEITKQRKFKPAGSIGGNGSSGSLTNQSIRNQQYANIHQNQQYQAEQQNDLIPGNRKSDVRRMMNTNF